MFRNKIRFYGEELLASSPTPKLEDHPLLAVRDCLFKTAAIHIGGCSSISNMRTRHSVVTEAHLLWKHLTIRTHQKCQTQLAQNVQNTCRYLATSTKGITEITTDINLNVTQK